MRLPRWKVTLFVAAVGTLPFCATQCAILTGLATALGALWYTPAI